MALRSKKLLTVSIVLLSYEDSVATYGIYSNHLLHRKVSTPKGFEPFSSKLGHLSESFTEEINARFFIALAELIDIEYNLPKSVLPDLSLEYRYREYKLFKVSEVTGELVVNEDYHRDLMAIDIDIEVSFALLNKLKRHRKLIRDDIHKRKLRFSTMLGNTNVWYNYHWINNRLGEKIADLLTMKTLSTFDPKTDVSLFLETLSQATFHIHDAPYILFFYTYGAPMSMMYPNLELAKDAYKAVIESPAAYGARLYNNRTFSESLLSPVADRIDPETVLAKWNKIISAIEDYNSPRLTSIPNPKKVKR